MIGRLLELYARCGESLLENGINNAVLPLHAIRDLLEIATNMELQILGGDIYTKTNEGLFEYTYESWSFSEDNPLKSIGYASTFLDKFSQQSIYVEFTFSS